MSLLRREDRVRLRTRNRQRSLRVLEFGLLDERRVSRKAGVELAEVRAQMAHDVFPTKAVAYSADFL